MFNESEVAAECRELFRLQVQSQKKLGELRIKLEKMLNEAYNIGYIEGHYKGLSEGRRTSDAKESPTD